MSLPPLLPLTQADAAFDVLPDYFLEAVSMCGDDEPLLREAVAASIKGFYGAMEAGGQERGERCGDVCFVDGVALEGNKRVRARLGGAIAHHVMAMWGDVRSTVR